MLRFARQLTTALAMAACLGAPAFAASGDSAASPELRLRLGYDGRLYVKVLDIEIETRSDRTGFGAEAQLTSSGILALLKHIHQIASSQGRIVDGTPRPGVFDTRKLTGKTRREVRTVWAGDQVTMTAAPEFGDLGDPPASAAQKRAAADPLTQLVRMTLAGSRARTCSRSYLFFDGKQLYALDFGPAADAPLTDQEQRFGLTGPFRCPVRFRAVAGFHKPKTRNGGLKHPIELDFARLGANGPLLITRLRAPTPLGPASIDLARLQTGSPTPG